MKSTFIFLKPGSDKTCCLYSIIKCLHALYMSERLGQEVEEHLYTNLSLDIKALNNYMSDQYGPDKDIDVSKYITVLDQDFFSPLVSLLDEQPELHHFCFSYFD